MMAPQWIDIISQALGWKGFKEACFYFIANMKEYNAVYKKAEIAKYTALEPEDLNDGAFDMQWCINVSDMLGKERLQMMYKSAKFLCNNSFHTRVKKYTDACLGRKDKKEFLQNAKEKRNKDDLNAYCICPITNDKDLLERYTFVQQLLKESKQFGAQRQAREKRTCEIALINLARNSKYETVTRLSWIMEGKMISQYSYLLEPQQLEDIEVYIKIDENGHNKIISSKNGKNLKSIPARLNKNEKILELKEIHKMWEIQYQRSRNMLETAMEERTKFTCEELNAIMENPIVLPIVSKLVLESNGNFGYYQKGKLTGLSNTYEFGEKIRIAHPYDLYKAGIWQDIPKDLFDKKIQQAFKQVFRELYLKLNDEIEKTEVRRYSGYQIQPKKAAGALKNKKMECIVRKRT